MDKILEIINSGFIKKRNELRDLGDDYNHICLYQKNDDYNYNDPQTVLKSVRGGWIDHCAFFVISSEIEARKIAVSDHTYIDEEKNQYTDLIDEWRTFNNISLDNIVGIALPFNKIYKLKKLYPDLFDDEFYDKLDKIMVFAKEHNWIVENSDIKDICDMLDERLNQSRRL